MKLAILADVHANLSALLAVATHIDAWQPDRVIVAGDTVNRGPRPAECLRYVQQRQQRDGWLIVRGNHEEYVIRQAQTDVPRHGPQAEIFASSYWTLQQLQGNTSGLTAMPYQQSFPAPDNSLVRVVHASVRGTRDGVFPDTPDFVLRQQIGQPPTPLFCVGHTHWPLIRRIDGTLVVNAGAAGLPFDGDRRASYAQVTWHASGWRARIVRLDYDWRQTERDFEDTGFLEGGGPLIRLVREELRQARSQLYQWTVDYEAAVLAGEMTLAESVARFLAAS